MNKTERQARAVVQIAVFLIILFVVSSAVWALYHAQIMTAINTAIASFISGLVNFIITLVEAIIFLIAPLGLGFYIAEKTEEEGKISSGWGLLVTIVAFILLGDLGIGSIGPIPIGIMLVAFDIGALVAFAFKLLEQNV